MFAFDKVETFYLENKIPVYIKTNPNSEFTALSLVFEGGVRYMTPETSGLEAAVFNFLSAGSKKFDYDEIQSFSYEKHSSFSNYSIEDGSVYTMECISRYFDETFLRFEDGFFNPSFSQREYDSYINSLKQNVHYQLTDPESMIYYSINTLLYQNHPFEAKVSVTQDSLANITVENMKEYYKSLLDSRKIKFVATGNVDSGKILSFLNRSFGKLPAASTALKKAKVDTLKVKGEPVVLVSPNATGAAFIARAFSSPEVTNPDYAAAKIVSEIYSSILYLVVREKHGICYTPYSGVRSSAAPYGMDFLYRVSNIKDFKAAMEEARDIFLSGNIIRSIDEKGNYIFEPVSKRIQGYINSYVTAKYKSQTNVGGVASRLAGSLLQFGNVSASDDFTQAVKETSAEDVIRVFKKYWCSDDFRWFAVVSPENEDKIEF